MSFSLLRLQNLGQLIRCVCEEKQDITGYLKDLIFFFVFDIKQIQNISYFLIVDF